jgi:rhamnogalacturonyl hydrolase YesR
MLQHGLLRDDDDKKWAGWLEEWMKWVVDEQHGLPRTREGGFQHS